MAFRVLVPVPASATPDWISSQWPKAKQIVPYRIEGILFRLAHSHARSAFPLPTTVIPILNQPPHPPHFTMFSKTFQHFQLQFQLC